MRSHEQPREERKMILTQAVHQIKTKNILKSSEMVIEGSGVVPPGDIGRCMVKKSLILNAHLSCGAD